MITTAYRIAQPSDLQLITGLLMRFYKQAGAVYRVPVDISSLVATASRVINEGICIVGPKSCAGALLAKFPWNNRAVIAHVVFWYFKNPREITILEELERHCVDKGAHFVNPSSLFPNNTVGRFYAKRGYFPAEMAWLKRVGKK